MSLYSWLQNLRSALASRRGQRKHARRGALRAATHRLNLEPLEDRRLLAFLAPVDYAAGSAPMHFVSADFNNDGAADLAVLNFDNAVSLLLNNGHGTLQPPVSYGTGNTGNRPVSLAVGDLDGDGNIDDLAIANYGYGYGYGDPGYGGNVSVLLGNDDGTLQPPRSVFVGQGRPASVAVGDFNGDGKMDLGVTANDYYYHSGGWISTANVLLGTGGGNFSAPKSIFLGRPLLNLALAADLNGDPYDDFVTLTPDYTSGQYLAVLLYGNSSGFLQGPSLFHTDSYGLAAGDINGDGDNDLVTGYSGVVLGDFTHDGNLDVITTGSVLYGRGDGSFSPPVVFAIGSVAAAGDFNGDGWLDAATTNQGGVSVLINDQSWPDAPPPPPPSVSIHDITVTEGNTGNTNAIFTVTLSTAYNQDVTVHYATANNTAVAGSDYTAASGDVTIPAGQLSKTFTVAVKGDRVAEPTETFAVNLSAPTNATIGDGQGIGTILDDEPRISINDVTVTEGITGSVNAKFTVTLSAIYDQAVTFHFDTANGSATAGSDYTAASGNVTVAAGATTQTFIVAVKGDRLAESTETFAVNLSAPTNATIGDGQGIGTILDDEPRVSISDLSKKEGKKNQTTQFTFTVTLSAAYDEPVTMSYRTVNGSATTGDNDYIAKTGTLTFKPGETSKTITIEVKGDSKKESNETFYLDLFALSSNALFIKNRGIGTILNDD